MTRKFKTLGLTMVAVLAMSSLVASTASATNDLFEAEKAPVTLTGNQHNGNLKFTLEKQAAECTTAKVNATVSTLTATTITTEVPSYSGCTYGGAAATVNMNGCKYILTGTTDTHGDAIVEVECTGTNKIELTLQSIQCKVFVASQIAEGGVTYTTIGVGTTRELTMHVTTEVLVVLPTDVVNAADRRPTAN